LRAWATSTGSTISRIGSFIAPTAVGALLAAMGCLGSVAIALLGPETSQDALEDVSAGAKTAP
jgi:hypothetical protein